MQWRRPSDPFVVCGVATATMTLGVLRAGDQPFWYDEAFTAGAAQLSFGDLLSFLWREAGMAPYYLALWLWAQVGQSEWWLRSLSVLGGAAAVAATYYFAARYVDRMVAAISVLALWCNSAFLYDLTELRAYSWTMCASVVSTMLFLRVRSQPTTRRAVAYGLAAGLSLALLAFSASLLAVHALFARPLWRTRDGRRAVVLAVLLAAVVFVPSLHALATSQQLDWIPENSLGWIDIQTAGAVGGNNWRVLLGLGGCLTAVHLLRRRWRGAPCVALETCVLGSLGSTVGLLAVSFLQPVFIARYLAPALPLTVVAGVAGYLLAARALAARVPRLGMARAAVGVALAAVCIIGFKGSPLVDLPRPEDMQVPGQALSELIRPGDTVVYENDRERLAMSYYFDGDGVAEYVGLSSVTRIDGCRLWVVARGSSTALDSTVRAVLPDAEIVVTQHSFDAIAAVDRCP